MNRKISDRCRPAFSRASLCRPHNTGENSSSRCSIPKAIRAILEHKYSNRKASTGSPESTGNINTISFRFRWSLVSGLGTYPPSREAAIAAALVLVIVVWPDNRVLESHLFR